MRVAVISDIHGNRLALEAVLADIERRGADLTVNLGDMVSGPLEPARTADLLFECDLPSVAGNHEHYLIANAGLSRVDSFARAALTPAQLDWLAALPNTLAINNELYLCHGTPKDADAPWLDSWMHERSFTLPSEAVVTAAAEGLDFPVLLCGHTHIPHTVRLRDGRLVVNPGSVGLQMNYGSPDARYAMVERHGGAWSVSFQAVPYDWGAAGQQAVDNGFAHWRDVLTGGWAAADGLF